MSGSRFPVGSSAMIRRGPWTMARAMAVRWMLATGQLVGSLAHLVRQADEREHPFD